MKAAAQSASRSAPPLQAALLDYFSAPGKYQLQLRQPALLFSSIREILQIAAGRGSPVSSAGRDADKLRDASTFFIRAALLYPGADHYAVLGLPAGAEPADMKERYRLLMRLIHPDFASTGGAAWPADAAVRVNRAYEVLSSPVLRREYDEQLAALRAQRPAAQARPAPHPSSAVRRAEPRPRRFGKKAAWAFGLALALPAVLMLVPHQEPSQLVQRNTAPATAQRMAEVRGQRDLPNPAPAQVASESWPDPVPAAPLIAAEAPPAAPIAAALPAPAPAPAPPPAPAPILAPVAPAVRQQMPSAPLPARPEVVARALAPEPAVPARRPAPAPAPAPATAVKPAVPAPLVQEPRTARAVAAAPMQGPPARPATAVAAAPLPPPAAPVPVVTPIAVAPTPLATAALAAPASSPAAVSRVIPVVATSAIPVPSLSDAQPLLTQVLQMLESGSGEQLLRLLDGDARKSPGAQALSRQYEQLVRGAGQVRLSQVEFHGEPRDGVLLVTGRVRLHAGEPMIGAHGQRLLLKAEFASRGGKVLLTGLSGTSE